MKYYFFHKEMWTECVYACVDVCMHESCIHRYSLRVHFDASLQWSLVLVLLCLVSVTLISSGLDIMEHFHFQLSFVEQGMAGAILTSILAEKTDGWMHSSYTAI